MDKKFIYRITNDLGDIEETKRLMWKIGLCIYDIFDGTLSISNARADKDLTSVQKNKLNKYGFEIKII